MLTKWRKKPVIIEARQWTGTTKSAKEIVEWVLANDGIARFFTGAIMINTLEGAMTATHGDFIICGVAGEFYPCKPEIFFASYEPVPSGENS